MATVDPEIVPFPEAPTSASPSPVDVVQTGEEADSEVDWEKLDRTEEQEPRGEGSDNVGCQTVPLPLMDRAEQLWNVRLTLR